MNKIPCLTCKEGCENIIGLYNAYHLVNSAPEINIEKMGLQCHKTGLYIELDLRRENE